MHFLSKSIVAFDLHDQVIQFVELAKTGRQLELRAFHRLALPKGVVTSGKIQDAEALATLVKELLSKANPSAVEAKEAVFMFPSKHVFTHIFKFPNTFTLKEIRKALVFEVETVVPFSVEEMVWDCTILEKGVVEGKDILQTVLFAGVPKTISQDYVQFFQSLGIKPLLFSIHVHAVLEALMAREDTFKGASFVIDLDPYSTTYLLLNDGKLRYILGSSDGSERFFTELTERFSLGADWMDLWRQGKLSIDFTVAVHEFMDKKFKEAQDVLLNNASDPHFSSVEVIYLTGEYASLTGLSDRLKTFFPEKCVLLGDPKHGVKVEDGRFLAKHQKEGGSIPFSVFFINAIGIAKHFLNKHQGINLLPEALKKSVFFEKLEHLFLIISFGLTVVTLLVSSWLLILQQNLTQNRTILEIQRSRIQNMLYGTRYQEVHSALTVFNQQINELSKVDQALFSVPDTFATIMEVVPEGISLTSFSFEDEHLSIQLVGVADKRETLLNWEKNLKEISFVSNVDAPLSNYNEKVNVSFTITLELSFSDLPHYDGSQNES